MATSFCPVCGLERSIIRSGNRVFPGEEPGEAPRLYRVLYLGCTNKKCANRYTEESAQETLAELSLEQPVEQT